MMLALTTILLLMAEGNCLLATAPTRVSITCFLPASGIHYPDQEVKSDLRFKNTGRDTRTFWVSYSVQDQTGHWYDISSRSVTLEPGAECPSQNEAWHVPPESSCVTGYYTVVMAVWDSCPEGGSATKIAEQKQQSSFQVLRNFEQFDDFNADLWDKGSHHLGKSYIDPKNVDISGGHARIRIPANTSNGGEIISKADFRYGTYRASTRLPDVSSYITGFFLYGGQIDAADEIDIEVYNDGNWKIEFTTWVHGARTNTTKKLLGFDPTACYHAYRIDFYPQKVGFFVDNQLMESYSSGLPTESMKLLINTWYPSWLSGASPSDDVFTCIDWIQY